MQPGGGERTPGVPGPARVRIILRPPEVAFVLIAAVAAVGLVVRVGWVSPVTREMCVGTSLYLALLLSGRRWPVVADGRVRLGMNYLCALWLYGATSRVTAALGTPAWDGALLAADGRLFGGTPSAFLQTWARPWLTDVMSACYAFYQVYLHGVLLVVAFTRPAWAARHLGDCLYTGFAVGFVGYLCVPALGPQGAFPALYNQPLAGGWATAFNNWLVGKGSAPYGTLPSLHLLITAILLDHDWRLCRRRFWWVLGPSLGLLASTLYLRYHYAVDLLAGLAAFAGFRLTTPRWYSPPP